MKIFLPFVAFLSLLSFAGTIASARKDVGEYWRAVMKDQPLPEALEGLVRIEVVSDEKIINVEDIEPRPNISAYGNDASLDGEKSSSSVEDFEPRPNISAYGEDGAGLKVDKKTFASDFEQEPNISIYRN